MSEQNDDQFEHDDLIDSLYQDAAGELPSAKIDNLILAKAKGQTAPVSNARKPRWAVPLVAVCLPALALGVVLKMGNFSFSEGSYEPATTDVYSTNDFVLHIPEEDAASKIKRVEKPTFTDLASTSRTDINSDDMSEAVILDAEMAAMMEQDTATDLLRARDEVLENARSTAAMDDAYNVEIKKLEASTQQNYENQALARVAKPSANTGGVSNQEMMDLPLAKTESLEEDSAVASAQALPESKKEEIVVSAARRMPESAADAAQVYAAEPMPIPTAPEAGSSGAITAMSAPAADQPDNDDLIVPAEESFQACPERRPETCTKFYQPVCGQRDTGVRCVMAPCTEAVEWLSYGNQCMACADDKVHGYYDGACETLILPTE